MNDSLYINSPIIFLLAMLWGAVCSNLSWAQVQCDPGKVMSAESCAQCHAKEVMTWKATPHFRTFDELGRRPKAKEICRNMGLRSAKRSDVCIACHFTTQEKNDRARPISGISCESCHGAARDWLQVHNDYGGPTATKENESPEHRRQRFQLSVDYGMHNTRNLYSIARNCYSCHVVPNEELVNVGGHNIGSTDFELVAWSQGRVRHNFLRTGGLENAVSEVERLRVMYVVGLIADLEFSTRASAQATSKSLYGMNVANRAAQAALKLYDVQKKIDDTNVQFALEAFAGAELKTNNAKQLNQIADEIQAAGQRFAETADGTRLGRIDSQLPDPSQYK